MQEERGTSSLPFVYNNSHATRSRAYFEGLQQHKIGFMHVQQHHMTVTAVWPNVDASSLLLNARCRYLEEINKNCYYSDRRAKLDDRQPRPTPELYFMGTLGCHFEWKWDYKLKFKKWWNVTICHSFIMWCCREWMYPILSTFGFSGSNPNLGFYFLECLSYLPWLMEGLYVLECLLYTLYLYHLLY